MKNLLNNTGRILPILLLAIPASIFAGWLVVQSQPFIIVLIVLCAAVAIVSFVKPEYGLLILVFGMVLSPEIVLVKEVKHDLIIRIEDIFLIIVFISWLAHITINKQLKNIIDFPLKGPIVTYVIICVVATVFGVLRGDIVPFRGFFYTLKYTEYFVLFFISVNVIKKPEQITMYLWAGLISCIIVTLYVYITYDTAATVRATAPFEGFEQSEPASLGGYYLIALAFILSYMVYSKSIPVKIFLLLLFLSIIPPFVFTRSRSAYFAFIPMSLCIFLIPKNLKISAAGLVLALVLTVILLSTELGSVIKKRVLFTFEVAPVNAMNTAFEPSARTRIESWKAAATVWMPQRPVIGWGVTAVGLVDSQIPRVAGETGTLGLLSFFWLLASLWRKAWKSYTYSDKPITRALSLGFLACFIGIITQTFGANSFIIIRIMEPFWFAAAIVVLLPKIYTEEKHATV